MPEADSPASNGAPLPKIGRPTNYDPAYCERVIELGYEGAGRYEIAHALGCAYSTMQLWEKTHPEFAQALITSHDFSQAWWATQGRKGIWSKEFNSPAYALQVKNRFPADWKDKREVDMPGGINIHISHDDEKL